MGSRVERMLSKVTARGLGWASSDRQSRQSDICMQINQEEQLGSKTDCQPRVLLQGNKASKPLTEKPVGVEVAGETTGLTGEIIGETYWVLEGTQPHPPRTQHQKGQISLWVVVEVTES